MFFAEDIPERISKAGESMIGKRLGVDQKPDLPFGEVKIATLWQSPCVMGKFILDLQNTYNTYIYDITIWLIDIAIENVPYMITWMF